MHEPEEDVGEFGLVVGGDPPVRPSLPVKVIEVDVASLVRE